MASRERLNGVLTEVRADGGAETVFDGFVEGLVEDVGEEGDDGKTDLRALVCFLIYWFRGEGRTPIGAHVRKRVLL